MKRVTLLLLVLLSGCASTQHIETPEAKAILDALTANIPLGDPEKEMLALGAAAADQIDARIDDDWTDMRKFRQLQKYLFDAEENNIQYDSVATFPASRTFAARYGNCLSISTLFIAAARHIGIESEFKTVSVTPTWDQAGNTMIRYEHIVAVGKLSTGEDYVIDFLPEFSIGQRSSRLISDVQALALFYNNLGAESVVDANYEAAVDYLLRAIVLWPDNSDTWNNLGAAYRRQAQYRLSEMSFKRSLTLDRNNYSALSNLTQLYLAGGRDEEAAAFLDKVDRYYKRNPYFHYYLAKVHSNQGEFLEAEAFLKSAISLKRDDPTFFDALAIVYTQLGDEAKSTKAEQKAVRIRERSPNMSRYQRERWLDTMFIRR